MSHDTLSLRVDRIGRVKGSHPGVRLARIIRLEVPPATRSARVCGTHSLIAFSVSRPVGHRTGVERLIESPFIPVSHSSSDTPLCRSSSRSLSLSLSRSPSPDLHQLPLYLLVDATLTVTESKGLWQARAAAADERTLLGTRQAFSLGYHPVQPPRSARPWKAGRAAGVGGRG